MCIVSLIVLNIMFLLEHKQECAMIYKFYPTSEYTNNHEVSVLITHAGLSVIFLRLFSNHYMDSPSSYHNIHQKKLKHNEKNTFVVVYNCLVIAFKNA